MSILRQKPIPVPTKPQPIRPQPRRETSPFAKIIDGRRVIDDRPTPPDPDAVERMLRLGILRPEQEVITTEDGEQEEVTVLKKRRKRGKGTGGGGGRMGPTYDVEECIRLAATGQWTAKDLAERYGVEPSTIRTRLRGRGAPIVADTRVDRKKIVDLYMSGKTVGEIHAELGNAIGTIYRVLDSSEGVVRRDDRSTRSAMSDEVRVEIFALRAQGLSSREVARRLGVSGSNVRRMWRKADADA